MKKARTIGFGILGALALAIAGCATDEAATTDGACADGAACSAEAKSCSEAKTCSGEKAAGSCCPEKKEAASN